MEVYQPNITQEAANILIPIAKTISTDFSDNLYSKTIIRDVIHSLKETQKIHVPEANVRNIVHNRQLILEKFS